MRLLSPAKFKLAWEIRFSAPHFEATPAWQVDSPPPSCAAAAAFAEPTLIVAVHLLPEPSKQLKFCVVQNLRVIIEISQNISTSTTRTAVPTRPLPHISHLAGEQPTNCLPS